MAQETIVFTQGGELPSDILDLAQQMKPADVMLHTLPSSASAADIAVAMRDAEYLMGFVRFLPDAAYTQATRLKLVQVLSAGYDRVNIEGARKARVPICANGGANSVAVAEHTLMLILAVYKKLTSPFIRISLLGAGIKASRVRLTCTNWRAKRSVCVGLGNIGQQVARRVQAFDAKIIYYDAFRHSPEEEARLGVQYVPLNTLLETADVVSLHVPLNDSTRDMIDAGSPGDV